MAKRFRISLSFGGGKRSYVAEMAQILASLFGKDAILYDRFHEAEFSHCDLALQLPRLYADDSDLVVAVICNDYLSKQWCGLEWRAIYQLMKQKERQRLMLMRFNRVEPEGLFGLAGYSELDHKTPAEAAKLILERLALNEAKPRDVYTAQLKPDELSPPSAPSAPDALVDRGSLLQVLTWMPAVPQANLALPPIDLRDLFQDRLPIHPSVWSDDIPQRLAAALPAIRQLPQPLRTSLYCHLSIAWYVGVLLNPKAGFQVEPLQFSQGQLVLWGLGPGQLPPGNEGWRWECVEENEGSDLAVVISVSKAALADARHAIPKLGLSLAAIHHASVPVPGNEAIVDARHARWLADDLILAIHGLRARLRPQRLHLFPACPVALMLLLGQQAEACGPTTVYEFAYGAPEASYSAGMASGL